MEVNPQGETIWDIIPRRYAGICPLSSFLTSYNLEVMELGGILKTSERVTESVFEKADDFNARRHEEEVLMLGYFIIEDGLTFLSIKPFPLAAMQLNTNRNFADEKAAKDWLLERLRKFREYSIAYSKERESQGLPVKPLPDGVTLPELPEV